MFKVESSQMPCLRRSSLSKLDMKWRLSKTHCLCRLMTPMSGYKLTAI